MNVPLTRYWVLLSTYLRPQWRRVALLGAVLLCNIALQLLNPQILRGFIDTARAGGSLQSLTIAALIFLGLALAIQLLSVAETYVAENIGWTATNSLRADLTLHCLYLDPDFHAAHTPGAMIERIDGDVAVLGNFFSRFVVYVLGNALLLAGVLALLYGIDPRIGAALTLFVVVTLLVMNRLRDVATPSWAAARQASATLFGFLEERIAGAEDLRANGATPYVMRGLSLASRNLLRQTRLAALMGVSTGGAATFLFALGAVVALALGAYLYTLHAISIGTVYLIFYYTQMLNRPIEQITRQIEDLQQAGAGIMRIGDLLATRSAIVDGPGVTWPRGALAVEFDNVSFGYAPPELALRRVAFALRPGRVLGVIGRTGSGKTTLTRLLFRLYDPTGGVIRLGGHDLRRARVAELRGRIGIVTQEIQLFHASVRDNLTLFDPSVPDERILAVLEQIGLWEWYQGLPDGLETTLASGGGGLSAGEAQLLAFVRVFLEDPGVVILDEASSRLDPATERRIERAVDHLLHGRTAIVIAHRLATLDRADDILLLEDGCIVEQGQRARLMADPASRYAALLRVGLEETLA